MNDVIYLEPDEEITSVVDRIRKSEKKGVAFVIPRGSTIGQSIINLKLLKRSAANIEKQIAIVTGDKIIRNLAEQVKIPVFDRASEAEKAILKETLPDVVPLEKIDEEEDEENKFKRYDLSSLNKKAHSDKETKEDTQIDEDDEVEPEDQSDDSEKEAIPADEEEISMEDDCRSLAQDEPETTSQEETISARKSEDPKGAEMNKKRYIHTDSRRGIKVFASICALAILILAAIFGPSAKATINLKAEDYEQSFDVEAQKDPQQSNDKVAIKSQLAEVEKTLNKQFDATGEKDNGTPAKGKITISNSVSTKAQILQKGAKATAKDGKVFVLDSGVIVPAVTASTNCRVVGVALQCDMVPGVVETAVTAEENGDAYNLSPTTFTVNGMSAESKAAFSGGVSKKIKFVTEDDLKSAQENLRKELAEQGKVDLLSNAEKGGQKVCDKFATDEIISVEADRKVNDEVEKFMVEMKIKVYALAFSEQELKDKITKEVENKLGGEKMVVDPEGNSISYTLDASDNDTGTITMKVKFTGKIGKRIIASDIKKQIKAKISNNAQKSLSAIEGVDSAAIKVTPSFLAFTPILSDRIKVEFNYQE
ncbi:MAG: hypothetical protein WC107_03675 [Patescibacteria group bacterium]